MASPFKGMGGGMPDMAKIMSLQKKITEDAEKMQNLLTDARIEGVSGGAVKAVVDGHGNVVTLTLNPEAVDPAEVELLQDMIVSAIGDAQEKAEDLREAEQRKMMPNIPGMPGLF